MSTNYEMWCLQYNEENNAKLTGWKFLCTNLCSNALFPVRLSPTTTTVHLVSLAIFLLVIFISIVSFVNSLWKNFDQLLTDNFKDIILCAIVGIFNNTHLQSFHCHLLLSHFVKTWLNFEGNQIDMKRCFRAQVFWATDVSAHASSRLLLLQFFWVRSSVSCWRDSNE